MPLEECLKLWMYTQYFLLILPSPTDTARPRFDTSTDMGLVLVPADAEPDSVIFRLRATDQDADFPLIFDITATVTPIVRIENLPCTLYNKVCQANVILTKRLVPGRLHDFAVRVKDSKGDSNSMQATISVTNATTQRDKIFPHIPAIIMVPEDAKAGKELDYVLVRSNQWSGKPVYIELWQPKELFTIRQRQTPAETRGVITLIGELDFETQSMYSIKMYATDPYTEPKKDTRNIAGLDLVVIVQDVQDVPPIFTMAPPLTKINNTVQPGEIILRVHAEDGDKGVPREVTYGLVSEGNPFTPFFNISEKTGEVILARPLEELTLITHVGAPVVLSIVAEEIRRSTNEPPAQATVVEVGLLLGEPGNSPPFFENDNYVAWIDENPEPGSVLNFTEHYSTKVRDEDIGKAGVFALKLYKNNGTFEINPTVAERLANFIVTVRDNSLIDYEQHKSLIFEIIAQEVGPATNLSATVPCTIFIRDINDNVPEFDSKAYEVTLPENTAAGTRVVQIHATDKDTGIFGKIQYTQILGSGNEAFIIDPNSGIITVAMGNKVLDRESMASLQLSVEARDEDGYGLRGIVPLIVHLLDINDNPPIFEKELYEFTLNLDFTNFTTAVILKAFDADAEPPNNQIRYELIHGNYENKFLLDEITGELFLREPINKIRRTRHNQYQNYVPKVQRNFFKNRKVIGNFTNSSGIEQKHDLRSENSTNENKNNTKSIASGIPTIAFTRIKRKSDEVLFTLTARAYDLGVPHLSGVTQINILKGPVAGARVVSFIVPGENPDREKIAETLAAITGDRVIVQEIRPFTINDVPSGSDVPNLQDKKKSIVIARVEPINDRTSLVDIEKIRAALAANGVGVIDGDMSGMDSTSKPNMTNGGTSNHETKTITNITTIHNEEVTIYKAENRLLFWLLIILGLLILIALIIIIICCICPGCPFYMAPRKRRIHSSELLVPRSDGRPKRHLHRKQHARLLEGFWPERKQAWSADPTRRNWQFNRRNQKASGLASLPGDVRALDREQELFEKTASWRLRDGPRTVYPDQMRKAEEERIYIEDIEAARGRDYDGIGSFRYHNPEHTLEAREPAYMNQSKHAANQSQSRFVREQHFYRDGNAEILRLVTRGQVVEGMTGQPTKVVPTLLIDQGQFENYHGDGKDILLQRFIEDQKHRGQELHHSFQDIEDRSMESVQHKKDSVGQHQQTKILLLPERLEEDHRHHIEELGPDVQRLVIDHGNYRRTVELERRESQEPVETLTLNVNVPISKPPSEQTKEQTSKQDINVQQYSIHDLELARQNAILTKLLLGREVAGGPLADSASYLETQSLPGQVAIATQTDRTAATQTELPNRSRSDNDESEEEARIRKKLKSKKRYTDTDPRRIRTLWLKSPIQEEEMQYDTEKRTFFLRKKAREVKDNRRMPIEPDVLREISDSLDEYGDPPITARKRQVNVDDESKVELHDKKERKKSEDSSSVELRSETQFLSGKDENEETTREDKRKSTHREKRENLVEPSFRILEKEMNNLSKKLSLLAGKKILQCSNGSETDSHKTDKIKKEINAKKLEKKPKASDTKKAIKVDTIKTKRSKSTLRSIVPEKPSTSENTKVREENVHEKSRKTSKYRKLQTTSTGSSDIEETVEKGKKLTPVTARIGKKPSKLGALKESPNFVTSSEKSVEERDTLDTASRGSIKSHRGEKDSTKLKRYRTGVHEEQSMVSGSASSDSLKDKRIRGKPQTIIKDSHIKESDNGQTEESEQLSTDYSNKHYRLEETPLNTKKRPESSNEKPDNILIKKSPQPEKIAQTVKLMVENENDLQNIELKESHDNISEISKLEDKKDIEHQRKGKPTLKRSEAMSEEKFEIEQALSVSSPDKLINIETSETEKVTSQYITEREKDANVVSEQSSAAYNKSLEHILNEEKVIEENLKTEDIVLKSESAIAADNVKIEFEIVDEHSNLKVEEIHDKAEKLSDKKESTEQKSEENIESKSEDLGLTETILENQTSRASLPSRPITPEPAKTADQMIQPESVNNGKNLSDSKNDFSEKDNGHISENMSLPSTNEKSPDLSKRQPSPVIAAEIVDVLPQTIDIEIEEKTSLSPEKSEHLPDRQTPVEIVDGTFLQATNETIIDKSSDSLNQVEEVHAIPKKNEDESQLVTDKEISIPAQVDNLMQQAVEVVTEEVFTVPQEKIIEFVDHEIEDSTQALKAPYKFDKGQGQAVDVVTEAVFTVPQEKIIEFVDHEIKDSTQALEAPYKFDKEQGRAVDVAAEEIFTIPQEKIIEFVDHEIKDSTQALEAPYKFDKEQGRAVDVATEEVFTIPQEKIIEFADHEIKDSTQALEAPYKFDKGQQMEHIISEISENITIKDQSSSTTDDGKPTTLLKIEDTTFFKDNDESKETEAEPVYESKNVEDEAVFSDNFDSFSAADIQSINSDNSQSPEQEISYKPLSEEHTQEPPNMEERDNFKGEQNAEMITEEASSEKPENIESTIVDISEKPSTSKTFETSDDSGGPSSTKSFISSPLPDESKSSKLTQDILDDTTIEVKQDTSKEIKQLELKNSTEVMEKSAESMTMTEMENTELKLHPEQEKESSETKISNVETIEKTEENDILSKDSNQPQILQLQTPQPEFGIADTLFIDAKIVTEPSVQKIKETEAISDIEPKIEEDETQMYVPPIDLAELSRTMLEDPDESDSSDISNKTMLTARPYGTPRHRNISTPEEQKALEESVSVEPMSNMSDNIQKLRETLEPRSISQDQPSLVQTDFEVDNQQIPEKIIENIPIEDDNSTEKIKTINTEQTGSEAGEEKPIIITDSDDKSKTPKESEVSTEDSAEQMQISEMNKNTLPPDSDKTPTLVVEMDESKINVPKESEFATEGSANQVQLSQIDKKILSADTDPHDFTSLTETRVSVKSPDKMETVDEKEYTEVENLLEIKEKAANEIGVDELDINASLTLKTKDSGNNVESLISSGMKTLQEETGTEQDEEIDKTDETRKKISPEGTSTSAIQILEEETDEREVEKLKGGAKIVPYIKEDQKTIERKRLPPKEGRRKDTKVKPKRKDTTSDKDLKINLNESPGFLKEVVSSKESKHSRTSDSKKAFQDQQTEQQISSSSRSEGLRRSQKKKEDSIISKEIKNKVVSKEKEKKEKSEKTVEKMSTRKIQRKKISKEKVQAEESSEDYEKTIEKRSTEMSSKRKKPSREMKKVREKPEKTKIKSFVPIDTIEYIDPQEQVHKKSEAAKESMENKESNVVHERSSQLDSDLKTNIAPVIETSELQSPSTEKLMVLEEKECTSTTSTISSTSIESGKNEVVEGSDIKFQTIHKEIIEQFEDDFRQPSREELIQIFGKDHIQVITKEFTTEPIFESVHRSGSNSEALFKIVTEIIKKREISEKEMGEERAKDTISDDSLKLATPVIDKSPSLRKSRKLRKDPEPMVIEGHSRYMEWYKLKREEAERKRQDRKENDEEEPRPKWMRKSTRQKWKKVGPEDKKIFQPEITSSRRKKIKPLINVESEQLKAIVRQGRKLRKAQGENADEPIIQIFTPEKPPPLSFSTTDSRYHHHLIQHSEYKYEKIPVSSFYLHPQPLINTPSQSLNPNLTDFCGEQKLHSNLPIDSKCPSETYSTVHQEQQQQGEKKLRHGELLEKKSVFDLAYNEAAPSQLRSDSTTPPS